MAKRRLRSDRYPQGNELVEIFEDLVEHAEDVDAGVAELSFTILTDDEHRAGDFIPEIIFRVRRG